VVQFLLSLHTLADAHWVTTYAKMYATWFWFSCDVKVVIELENVVELLEKPAICTV